MKTEDGPRRSVPIPICIKPLPRRGTSSVAPSLSADDYWSIVLPGYEPGGKTLDRNVPDCAGHAVLSSQELLQSEGPRVGPIRVSEADVVVGQGADGFKIAWFRTHKFVDGSAGGPIALLRPKEAYAEVYAVGLYRGRADKSRFSIERLGFDIIVTATDDGCSGVKGTDSCETGLTVFLMSGGILHPGARFSLDRIQYGIGAPLGVSGQIQFRLTATPSFEEKAIRLVEQVSVKDAAQREVRKSELERTFVRRGRTQLVASNESIWQAVLSGAGGGAKPATPGTAAPPSR